MASTEGSAYQRRVFNVTRVDGVYYDTAKLAALHPGGETMVKMVNGLDSTRAFVSYHRRRFPHAAYKHLAVDPENVAPGAVEGMEDQTCFKKYLELCNLVRPVIMHTGGFAPWHYYIKAFLLCFIVVALDAYAFFAWRPLYLTVLQSFAMALVALNVQHDANHGAISRQPFVNGFLGLSQDMLGGSRISWIIHHNFIHHIFTNEPHRDLDLEIPLLRLHRFIPRRGYHALQHIYILMLEALFGPVHVISSMLFVWRGPDEKHRLLRVEWFLSRLLTLVAPLRLTLNMLHAPTLSIGILSSVLQYGVGGMYLAFFFLISHNFSGVEKGGASGEGYCFLMAQVESSSNVCGWWLAQLHGGLNYQIEHHLFPRIHHSYYHAIAPIVREYCSKHGIRYVHFKTVLENTVSTFNHLAAYGCSLEYRKDAATAK
ncbi:putative Fatty acid desaturase [Trypanosoma vivax]|uniref:Putative delta-6 fatty acid desaturase n=1 Tax=Trypanosoma vivax (strain Y486) TaxID=1055687 RepID=G0U743_TRYVY|nr:putative Fatty acid desaturase [Trypanosoma vivax]CCC51700.1 putative delta-6 fatty acid desaturase [Trypanosoma vivax Y486]